MRGDQEGGLGGLVKRLIPEHEEISINHPWLRVPYKKSLTEQISRKNEQGKIRMLGTLYEVLTAGITGGRLPTENEKKYYLETDEGIPDVIIEQENRVLESKAAYKHRTHGIKGLQ